jgi:serine/threonine protein kinase/tetratricopeptide (TPR) repeat protein
MKCPTCHSENPDTTRFCGMCATELSHTEGSPVAATAVLPPPPKEVGVGSVFAGRYEVVEELGKGGMGRVYKVWDKEVEEEVALKLLNPQTGGDAKSIERFRSELKLARQISHRNVCRVYDLSKHHETYYITMEYVQGEDLKSSIRKMGALGIGRAVSIARQVCEGLAEAHRLGVVHRDLKPQNIMVDKNGNVRIMDFGIARSIKTKGVTETGVIIGTPEYISVEQVEGAEADHRSDIYSLGIILYEMVTGKVPYDGDTPLSVAVKHTTQFPEDPRELNAQVPVALSRLILKCIAKNRGNRYQSVEALVGELGDIVRGISTAAAEPLKKRPAILGKTNVWFKLSRVLVPGLILLAVILAGTGAWRIVPVKQPVLTPAVKPSLAVLHFENKSGDENLDFWQTGLAELLTADLRQSIFLKVVGQEAVFGILKQLNLPPADQYSAADLKKIAVKGRTDYILTGNFATTGHNLTIDAVLQNPHTGVVISSRRVGCEKEEDVPARIDQLTSEIKSDLNLSEKLMSRDIDQKSARIMTDSPEAYRHYIQGRINAFEGGPPGQTVDCMKMATSVDPEFASAYRAMAAAYGDLGLISQAWHALNKACELEGRLSVRDFYLTQAELYSMSEQTSNRTVQAYSQLLEIYPEDEEANLNLGFLWCYDLEQWDRAIERFEILIRNNPQTSVPYVHQAEAYMAKGMYDRARGPLETCLRLFPDEPWISHRISKAYLCEGELDSALAAIRGAWSVDPATDQHSLMGDIYHCSGDLARAEEIYSGTARTQIPTQQWRGYFRLAALYLSQGRFKDSKDQLKEAAAQARRTKDAEQKRRSHLYLAQVDLASGDPKEALKEWQLANGTASGQDLDSQPLLHLRGLICLDLHRLSEAEKAADELRETLLAKEDRKLVRYYHHLAGAIQLEKGNYPEAIASLQNAVSLLPSQHSESDDHALFLYPLAMAFYKSGDLESARQHFERIVSLTTGRLFFGDVFARSLYMLGKIYQKQGRPEDAMRSYSRFTHLWAEADPGIPELEDARKRLAHLEEGVQSSSPTRQEHSNSRRPLGSS